MHTHTRNICARKFKANEAENKHTNTSDLTRTCMHHTDMASMAADLAKGVNRKLDALDPFLWLTSFHAQVCV